MNDERANLLQLLFGFFPAQSLNALARLDVADHLAADTRTVEELARLTGTHERSLARLLRAATVLGVVKSTPDGRVGLTDAGTLLRSDVPGSIRNLAMLFCGDGAWRSWGHLEYSVRTGCTAFDHIFGRSTFQYLAEHPDEEAVFTEGMAESTRVAAPGIVASTDLAGVGILADIGGGNGTLLVEYLATFPQLRGVLFDSPKGLGDAERVLATAGVANRCEITTGDFFVSVPAGCDAYLFKSVIHDWDDEQAARILTNCRAAMPPDATLILAEPVMPDDPAELAEMHSLLMSDLNMLVCTGGRERTHADFADLFRVTGFTLEDITRCPPPTNYSVLRARPSPSR